MQTQQKTTTETTETPETTETTSNKVYTFEDFATKYIVAMINIVNHLPKKEMRKIIKNLVSFQSEETKQMLLETYNKKTERQIVNVIQRTTELYRFHKEEMKVI